MLLISEKNVKQQAGISLSICSIQPQSTSLSGDSCAFRGAQANRRTRVEQTDSALWASVLLMEARCRTEKHYRSWDRLFTFFTIGRCSSLFREQDVCLVRFEYADALHDPIVCINVKFKSFMTNHSFFSNMYY